MGRRTSAVALTLVVVAVTGVVAAAVEPFPHADERVASRLMSAYEHTPAGQAQVRDLWDGHFDCAYVFAAGTDASAIASTLGGLREHVALPSRRLGPNQAAVVFVAGRAVEKVIVPRRPVDLGRLGPLA